MQGRDLHSCAPASRSLRKLYAAGLTRGTGRVHHCGMQMRYEYETGPDRNSGTGRLPSDYQEVSVQMMTPEAWARTQELAGWDELSDAQRFAMAVGCPVHGNASMDWDADGVFCGRCDIAHGVQDDGSNKVPYED